MRYKPHKLQERSEKMKRIIMLIVVFLLALSVTACMGGGKTDNTPEDGDKEGKVKVLLTFDDNITVASENPVYVDPGRNAEFEITFDEQYALDSLSHGEYKGGKITVRGVTEDTVVKVSSAFMGYDTTTVHNFMLYGEASDTASLRNGERVTCGTMVTVNANEKFKVFLGWSFGGYTADKSKMISESRSYTCRLTPAMLDTNGMLKLYANYADTGAYIYDTNGGTLNMNTTLTAKNDYYDTAAEGSRLKVTVSGQYLNVIETANLFYDDGTFTRDGYVLAEYNTAPDGSGEGYSLGSKFYIDFMKSEVPVLYCIWKKASDASLFTYEEFEFPYPVKASAIPHWHENGVMITSYAGDEECVTVPEKIGDKFVTGIKAGAFVNKKMKTLVLPRSMQRVEAGAFVGCSKIETVYYPDSIYDISNESFDAASYTSFKHLYVNATMAPRMTKSNGFAVKLSRLLASGDKNRIIFIAGSSTYQGLSSEYMEALLEGEYRVINFGTTRTTNGMIYLEAMKYLAREGDIIVYAPENSTYMMGEYELYWKTLNDMEGMYNLYRLIDISNYTNVFSSFADFNQTKRYVKNPARYEQLYDVITADKFVNKYGEYQKSERVGLVDKFFDGYFITLNNRYKSKNEGQWDDKEFQIQNKDYTDPNNVTWESIDSPRLKDSLNRAIAAAKSSGAAVYFGFCPVDADHLVPEAKNSEWLAAYDKLIMDTFGFDGLLGTCKSYIFAHKYFYDNAFHPNDTGRTYRTYQCYLDICDILELPVSSFTSHGTEFEGCIFEDGSTGKPLAGVDYLQ